MSALIETLQEEIASLKLREEQLRKQIGLTSENLADHVEAVFARKLTEVLQSEEGVDEDVLRATIRNAILSHESANAKLVEDLTNGKRVILPKTKEHALQMYRVAHWSLELALNGGWPAPSAVMEKVAKP